MNCHKSALFLLVTILVHNVRLQNQYAELDLKNELRIFKECLVQIVLNEVPMKDKGTRYHIQSYPFPIMLTRYYYGDLDNGTAFYCDCNKFYGSYQEVDFKASRPFYKLTCFAQVYVTPSACLNWIPPSYYHRNMMFAFFDHRYDFEEIEATKYNTFFIHVELHKSLTDSITDNQKYRQRFHYIDNILAHPRHTNNILHLLFSSITKLSFIIRYHPESTSYRVVYTGLLACVEYPAILSSPECQQVGLLCDDLDEWVCDEVIVTNVLEYHAAETPNLNTLESLHPGSCNMRAINFALPTNTDKSKPCRHSFLACNYDNGIAMYKIIFANSSLETERHLMFLIPMLAYYVTSKPRDEFQYSTQLDGVHFITCAPVKKLPPLSLIGYVSAFDLKTWLMIVSCFVISAIAWNVVNKYTTNCNKIFFTFYYSILVGQSTKFVNKIRWITGSWILAGIFLTYNYQGNNIDELTSPLVPKKLETFEEVFNQNFTIFSLPNNPFLLQTLDYHSNYSPSSVPLWDVLGVTFGEALFPLRHEKAEKIPSDKAWTLFHKLFQRTGSYSILLQALKETRQTGAVRIIGQLSHCDESLATRREQKHEELLEDIIKGGMKIYEYEMNEVIQRKRVSEEKGDVSADHERISTKILTRFEQNLNDKSDIFFSAKFKEAKLKLVQRLESAYLEFKSKWSKKWNKIIQDREDFYLGYSLLFPKQELYSLRSLYNSEVFNKYDQALLNAKSEFCQKFQHKLTEDFLTSSLNKIDEIFRFNDVQRLKSSIYSLRSVVSTSTLTFHVPLPSINVV
ncbi:unnamed protein product [Orchesella dallaii]|uniref:Uncharacterized protein n=1 Tax=Orchesella dallaii TaxID=48710 RepID=A0ABP1S0M5_9HEXA